MKFSYDSPSLLSALTAAVAFACLAAISAKSLQAQRLPTTVLDYGDFDRRVTEDEHAAVRRSVPAIDVIERLAPQRPHGQVEPERRARTKKQRREITRPARSRAGGRHVGYVTAAPGSSSAVVAWTGCSARTCRFRHEWRLGLRVREHVLRL